MEAEQVSGGQILVVSAIAVAVAIWLATGGYEKVTKTITHKSNCPPGYVAVNEDPAQGKVSACVRSGLPRPDSA